MRTRIDHYPVRKLMRIDWAEIASCIAFGVLVGIIFWAANWLTPDSYSGECELTRAALAAKEK